MNTLHTHALPSVDRPLVTENLVGGDEGFADAGMSLSHLINNPVLYLELTGEVFAGLSDVFHSAKRSELTYVGRVRGYHDLNDASNIDLGASFRVRALDHRSAAGAADQPRAGAGDPGGRHEQTDVGR
jgi:hypothetical protein